jgi:hypothetical protein
LTGGELAPRKARWAGPLRINVQVGPERTAAVIEQIKLVGDLVIRSAKALAQKFGDMAAEGLVAWAPGHGADEFGELVASPGHRPIMLQE